MRLTPSTSNSWLPPGKSVRPTEPANRASPVNTAPGAWRQTPPAECPGVWMMEMAVIPDLQDLSFLQKAIGPCTECGGIEPVNQNRSLCNALQLRNPAHVVDVAVGDRDILYGEAGSGYFFDDTKHFISRVDNQALVGLLASQYVAVGLIRTDNKFSQHGEILAHARCQNGRYFKKK